MKIEDGLCMGTVLYHSYLNKTPEEILEIEKKIKEQQYVYPILIVYFRDY